MITAILLFLKAFPELLGMIKPLVDAYKDHGKEVVHGEINATFDRLKDAKTKDDQAKALSDLDSQWKR